ncbi:AraC family transcriptional regulator [Metabacillus halosaccharovorans]|uniref:GyrI-like domain-containing protein n=1 Tax=Metabacillus halosaccharovorans TaxID=930124 RepID=A0ABT3DEU0_9BACI|nr:GyrI-like domain-containing protein [Metabacillus halosaccharovorans]MCV9885568.1 GyrI-like domain-containing protein [Metabacillus halosaccharovorans]
MKCKTETIPNHRVAYVRRVGPYGPENIKVMEKLKRWAGEKDLLKSAILFGIPQDNPETTQPENCRFDACIVISENYEIDETISENEISGGKYLVYEVNHTAIAIQKAYENIFLAIQNNEFEIDNKTIMERYTGDINANPYCEICVPVISK